jgi:hypothetical protein
VKRLSEKQEQFQRWKSAYAIKIAQKKNAALEKKRKKKREGQTKKKCPQSLLVAPSHFVLISKRTLQNSSQVEKFFEFLTKLRLVESGPITIDMSTVSYMVVDAALLFKAELSRLIQVRCVSVEAIPPNSERVQQVLKQTEIHKLLNLSIDLSPDREDVVHWHIAEGPSSDVDPTTLAPIMSDIEAVTGMASHPVYQGIIESMGNCVEHAYKAHPDVNRLMPSNPGWWVFQQVKEDTLSVYVCDLGIGVNRALPLTLANEQGMLKKLMHLARRAKGKDCRSLLAAMEYGRTGTGLHYRGKGMRNAHAVVNDLGVGDFYAISNQGCYIYRKTAGSAKGTYRTIKLRYSINGTILGWVVPLKRTQIPTESLS